MKNIMLILLVIMGLKMRAQSEVHTVTPVPRQLLPPQADFIGLIGYSYQEVIGERAPVIVNKPLYIIYNSNYCKLSIAGVVNYFEVDPSYTRELEKGNVVESFMNAETNTIRRGWYDITIQHNKTGTSSLTINLPMLGQVHAYIINNAKIYSEDGRAGNAHVENWKEIPDKIKKEDSLSRLDKIKYKDLNCKARPGENIAEYVNNKLSQEYGVNINDDIGAVDLYFVVTSTGQLTMVKTLNDFPAVTKEYYNKAFVNKVIESFSSMPNWKPAISGGKPTLDLCTVHIRLGKMHLE